MDTVDTICTDLLNRLKNYSFIFFLISLNFFNTKVSAGEEKQKIQLRKQSEDERTSKQSKLIYRSSLYTGAFSIKQLQFS